MKHENTSHFGDQASPAPEPDLRPKSKPKARKEAGKKPVIPPRKKKPKIPSDIARPVKWPKDAAGQRDARDKWMDDCTEAMVVDDLAYRVLWPIFSTFNWEWLNTIIPNSELSRRCRRSESVCGRGLATVARAGWIIILISKYTDDDGNVKSLRRIRLARPSSFKPKPKPKPEAVDANGASPDANCASENANCASANAQQDEYTPERITPESKTPALKTPEKERTPSGGFDSELLQEAFDTRLFEHPFMDSDISNIEVQGHNRKAAENMAMARWIKEHWVRDPYVPNQDIEADYKAMDPAEKKWLRAELLRRKDDWC
ncbi:hypothetical protein [Mesorhizobium sp. IMUNJ 23232]|uniref:hypothetical protein n=1 Tax=Mesorhizobium sp. IMUNJ 23232 TaxID=3376064 RepID=UPI0037883B62